MATLVFEFISSVTISKQIYQYGRIIIYNTHNKTNEDFKNAIVPIKKIEKNVRLAKPLSSDQIFIYSL